MKPFIQLSFLFALSSCVIFNKNEERQSTETKSFKILSTDSSTGQKISGKIIDKETFEAISNVGVICMDTAESQIICKAKSDQYGTFLLEIPGTGHYTVKFMIVGYQILKVQNITMKPNSELKVQVALKVQQSHITD